MLRRGRKTNPISPSATPFIGQKAIWQNRRHLQLTGCSVGSVMTEPVAPHLTVLVLVRDMHPRPTKFSLQWCLLCVVTITVFHIHAGEIPSAAKPAVKPAVRIAVQPFDLTDVKLLDSPFKQAMHLNASYLLSLEPDRFLHYFRVNAGLEPKAPAYGGWESPTTGAGRCLGHYLSALSLQYRATGDSRFKERIDYIVSELAVCQQTNGFLSAQTNLAESFAALAAGHGDALLKSRVPWYIQHKMFAGLRDAFFLTGNQQARQILIRLADWAVAVTSNLDREQFQTMLKQEYGGMQEVLLDVYALDGERKYLELARRFQDDATFNPLAVKLDKLAQKHANTMIPKLSGAVRLYELTGETQERAAAEYFWNEVMYYHTYALGGNSDHEHFGPPDQLPLSTQTAETCNTYNMLKLTRHLFCLGPEVKYGDYYERALYNQILASQAPKQGGFTYFISLKPGHFKTYSTPFESFWCCVGTGMENHTQYGNNIYYHDTNNLYVVLYIPSQLTWTTKNVTIQQETDYPASANMHFAIKCAKPTTFAFKFRYPNWAVAGMAIKVNGQAIKADTHPGEFASVEREWKNDDQVQVQFPLSLRAESLAGAPATKAFFFGPLLLAGDLGTNSLPAPIPYARDQCQYCDFQDPKVPVLVMDGRPLENWVKPVAGELLTFRTVNAGRPADVILRPFYRLHYQRYTVYWDVVTPEQWEKQQGSTKD